jgi:zinc transport system substrate-binding protein
MLLKKYYNICLFISFIFTIILLSGCRDEKEADTRPVICVTNSWLECAVKDVAGDTVRITRLLPPGHCPGHFDLSPKHLDDIRKSDLLLRFHFQSGMDAAFSGALKKGAEICSITIGEGQSVPDTYFASATEVSKYLSKRFPEKSLEFDKNILILKIRLDELNESAHIKAKELGLDGKNAVCSQHQAVFCRWIGLNVLAEFQDLSDAAASDVAVILQKAGENKVDFIVGNFQGGSSFAMALGERFGAPMVVLSNFPSMLENEDSFEKLVINNVEKFKSNASE